MTPKYHAVDLKVEERVMIYMPSEAQGKDRKLARRFHGLYRVLTITPTNVNVPMYSE